MVTCAPEVFVGIRGSLHDVSSNQSICRHRSRFPRCQPHLFLVQLLPSDWTRWCFLVSLGRPQGNGDEEGRLESLYLPAPLLPIGCRLNCAQEGELYSSQPGCVTLVLSPHGQQEGNAVSAGHGNNIWQTIGPRYMEGQEDGSLGTTGQLILTWKRTSSHSGPLTSTCVLWHTCPTTEEANGRRWVACADERTGQGSQTVLSAGQSQSAL